MKKIILLAGILFLLILAPILASAAGLVPCGNPGEPACGIRDFFVMLTNIYGFIVWYIATPLAVLALTIGGIFILISAGNPNLMGKGKQILYAGMIGLILVFCSWLIINTILFIIGYTGNWSNPFS